MRVLLNEQAEQYLEKIISQDQDVDQNVVGITNEMLAFRPLGDSLEFKHCESDMEALKFIHKTICQ